MRAANMRVPNQLLLLLVVGVLELISATQADYSQYVNPFMGSEGPTPGQGYGGGDIFVGGARPFGVVKVGIDTTAANWSLAVLNGGWTPDGNVTAVSMFISLWDCLAYLGFVPNLSIY